MNPTVLWICLGLQAVCVVAIIASFINLINAEKELRKEYDKWLRR